MMLGDEAALSVEQAEFGAVAEFPHHRAGRMRHVGVERRAEEGQSSRHRRPHVVAKAQGAACHLWYAGKAAIELDRVEFAAVAAGEGHRRPEHGVLRMV